MDWVMGKKKGYPKMRWVKCHNDIYIYTYVLYLYKYICYIYIYVLYIYIYVIYVIYVIYMLYIYICYIYIYMLYLYMLYIYMLCIYICYMYMNMYNIYIYVYTWLHTLDFLVWMQRLLDVLLVSDEKTHPTILGHNNQLVKSPPMVWSWHEAGQVPQGVDVLAAARGPGGVNMDYPWT